MGKKDTLEAKRKYTERQRCDTKRYEMPLLYVLHQRSLTVLAKRTIVSRVPTIAFRCGKLI